MFDELVKDRIRSGAKGSSGVVKQHPNTTNPKIVSIYISNYKGIRILLA